MRSDVSRRAAGRASGTDNGFEKGTLKETAAECASGFCGSAECERTTCFVCTVLSVLTVVQYQMLNAVGSRT